MNTIQPKKNQRTGNAFQSNILYLSALVKKIGTTILLFAALLQSGGLAVFYDLQEVYLKYEVAALLSHHDAPLEKLVMTSDEFHKSLINTTEIEYQGKMYDVSTCHFDGNKVVLMVYCDTNEAEVLQNIKDLAKGSDKSQNSLHIRFMKLLQLTSTPPNKIDIVFFHSIQLFATTFLQVPKMVGYEEIPSPPPKFS